ncbi:hypothetical protein [Dasania marina]|uniref:hypothetical protein n=1 Tax=Dasania marina TaxID=471499 RepID=UPI0003726228|nr:hypothetical protein [Dasania marina]
MDVAVKRIINRQYPELAGNYHHSHWGKVIAVAESRSTSQFSDEAQPAYTVDVQLLDINLKPVADMPNLTHVPVTLPAAGNERGFFGLPTAGAIVEIAFAYASPLHPFVRSVLPHGLTLPSVETNEVKWQQSAQVTQRADTDGNWERITNQAVRDIATKHYAGDDTTNIYQLIADLMAVVSDLANHAATHGHTGVLAGTANSGPPVTAADFVTDALSADNLKTTLDPLVE